jgi:hypothetical protein
MHPRLVSALQNQPRYIAGGHLDDDSEFQFLGPKGREEHSRPESRDGPPPKIVRAGPEGRVDPDPHPLPPSI